MDFSYVHSVVFDKALTPLSSPTKSKTMETESAEPTWELSFCDELTFNDPSELTFEDNDPSELTFNDPSELTFNDPNSPTKFVDETRPQNPVAQTLESSSLMVPLLFDCSSSSSLDQSMSCSISVDDVDDDDDENEKNSQDSDETESDIAKEIDMEEETILSYALSQYKDGVQAYMSYHLNNGNMGFHSLWQYPIDWHQSPANKLFIPNVNIIHMVSSLHNFFLVIGDVVIEPKKEDDYYVVDFPQGFPLFMLEDCRLFSMNRSESESQIIWTKGELYPTSQCIDSGTIEIPFKGLKSSSFYIRNGHPVDPLIEAECSMKVRKFSKLPMVQQREIMTFLQNRTEMSESELFELKVRFQMEIDELKKKLKDYGEQCQEKLDQVNQKAKLFIELKCKKMMHTSQNYLDLDETAEMFDEVLQTTTHFKSLLYTRSAIIHQEYTMYEKMIEEQIEALVKSAPFDIQKLLDTSLE
jgi:hypothetical protein